MKVVSMWSGGKDSCFACYKAIEAGHDVRALVNFINSETGKSMSHNLDGAVIKSQCAAIGIHLEQVPTTKKDYSRDFKAAINRLKKKDGIEGIVFGDIYLQEHRDWIDKICLELDVKAILPLWKIDTKTLIEEFVGDGFKTRVVAVNNKYLTKDWIGRDIDRKFIKELETMGNIDLCGEKGEFHTFVYDGPIFKKRVEVCV